MRTILSKPSERLVSLQNRRKSENAISRILRESPKFQKTAFLIATYSQQRITTPPWEKISKNTDCPPTRSGP